MFVEKQWCLTVSCPRLRCVLCPRAGACSFSLQVSDLSLRHAAGEGFLLGLRPDLGGVWMF